MYGVQFTYRGESHYVRFGGTWEGWDDDRAHGRASLPDGEGQSRRVGAAGERAGASRRGPARSFQVLASEWLHRQLVRAGDPEGATKTSRDLRWRLSVAIGCFGDVPADELGFAHAEDLVSTLCAERLAIERARELGAPLMEDYVDPRTGRRHRRRRRGLSNSSIRKVLDTAERVLRDAAKRGETDAVPDVRSAAPKAERPNRSYLEAHEIAAVLRAATLIEDEHRGLTWEKVRHIRASSASAVALSRSPPSSAPPT